MFCCETEANEIEIERERERERGRERWSPGRVLPTLKNEREREVFALEGFFWGFWGSGGTHYILS